MSTPRIISRPAQLALAFVLVLGLAACGPASTAVSINPEPSPTKAPVDIAQEFAAKMEASPTFVSDLTGTLRIGDLEGEISGELAVVGSDLHNLMVISFPGLPEQETETITVDGTTYERSDQGYWLRPSSGSGVGEAGRDPVTAALANVDNLEVVGTEEHDGVTLHRIENSRPAEIAPESFGFADPTIADFQAQIAFLAEGDGTPAGIIITAAWIQGTEDAPVPAEFELRYLVVDRDVTIEAPQDVWTQYRSAELGYQMDYPADWDVTHEPETPEFSDHDFYLGPSDGEVQIYRYTDLEGWTGNEWFRASADRIAENLGSAPELANILSLTDGLEVQVFIGEYTEGEATIFYQEAVVFGGDVAWDLDWFSHAGNEEKDQARFLQFVMSFQPLAE